MKVLWLTNVATSEVDRIINNNSKKFFGGGWLDGLANELLRKDDMQLVLCYPLYTSKVTLKGSDKNFNFYGFPADGIKMRLGNSSDKEIKLEFEKILVNEKPDIIHIHGTEFQYCYYMCCIAMKLNMLSRVVISVQGMVGIYAQHMFANLPMKIIKKNTIKELITRNNIYSTYKAYKRRGKYEAESIRLVKNIIGRTDWDEACAKLINPNINYYFANETLRDVFYSGQWNYNSCEKNTIFMSQSVLPIKGLHMTLRAIKEIKKFYPDVKLRVAGLDITIGNKINGSSYGLYLKELIKRYDLFDNVEFLGPLNENEMKTELLKANVFVSASSIENSPNSLGEAMILGVPCVASDVGGVKNLLKHEKEGYIYPFNEDYMLAYNILKVFKMRDKIDRITREAKKHAQNTHDPNVNSKRMYEIYNEVISYEGN